MLSGGKSGFHFDGLRLTVNVDSFRTGWLAERMNLVIRYGLIGHPHVLTIPIDKEAVRTHDQASTEFPQGRWI